MCSSALNLDESVLGHMYMYMYVIQKSESESEIRNRKSWSCLQNTSSLKKSSESKKKIMYPTRNEQELLYW